METFLFKATKKRSSFRFLRSGFGIFFLLSVGVSSLLSSAQALDLKELSSKNSLAIGFGSCNGHPNSPIWDSILAQSPDLFLFLGDNIYTGPTEWGDLEKTRQLYQRVFNNPGLRKFLQTIPTFAIWDDHDFGPNDSDSRFSGKTISLQAFKEQWSQNPAPPPGLEQSIAFEIDLGRVLILMTDDRTYRVNVSRNQTGSYWGKAQLDWIERKVKDTKASLIVLASGNRVLPQSLGGEALSQYPHEQQRLFKIVGQSVAPVIVISGDLHIGEILKRKVFQKEIVEIVSSPLTASASKKINFIQPNEYVGTLLQENNFGLLKIDFSENQISLLGALFDREGQKKTSIEQSFPLKVANH